MGKTQILYQPENKTMSKLSQRQEGHHPNPEPLKTQKIQGEMDFRCTKRWKCCQYWANS